MERTDREAGEYLRKGPCPDCGSSDARAEYSDGHYWCFSCETHTPGEGQDRASAPRKSPGLLPFGNVIALQRRGITEETCQKFGYFTTIFSGKPAQVAQYRNQAGEIAAQHVRLPDKSFPWLGSKKNLQLFGQHLWRDSGRMVVVTEGEIDAMTVSQLQGNKWPVVSIASGASGAKKDFAANLEWLESFESVVIMFDMDDAGQKAAQECALILSPGKAKIATLPLKDANECLQARRGKEVISAIWDARTYRPDGIVAGEELWELVTQEDEAEVLSYPWEGLTDRTGGLRRPSLVTITAGSGVGKSAICREIAKHLLDLGETVGMMMLEEDVKRSSLGLMGLHIDVPLHLSREGVTDEAFTEAFRHTLGTGRVYLYDHFGSTEIDNLLSKIRFMAKGLGCRWIILDHLSIVVSGLGDGDERRLIDNAMTLLRTLVQELGIGLILVSHLRRPSDKGHEEGAQVSLSQLRGSHAIAQLSDIVIGAERNLQGDDESKNLTTLRVLKNRPTGDTGPATLLSYDPETGRLKETTEDFNEVDPDDIPF